MDFDFVNYYNNYRGESRTNRYPHEKINWAKVVHVSINIRRHRK